MRWLLSPFLLVVGLVQAGETDRSPVILLDLGEESPRAVLLQGGGYRGDLSDISCLDKDVNVHTGPPGNALHLVDAGSGAVIWSAHGPGAVSAGGEETTLFIQSQMTHSIVAPVAPVDGNGNGIVDRAYVADTGGTLWRLTFPEAGNLHQGEVSDVLAAYSVVPLAVLGGEGVDNRQFFHSIDYVQSRDEAGDYDGIFLVSGDHSRLGESEVQNYAYLVKDRDGPAVTHDQLPDITRACIHRDSTDCRYLDSRSGWKLALQAQGEKGLSRPLVSRGVVYFSTYAPPSAQQDSCDVPGGEGQLYAVNLADGSPATDRLMNGEADQEQDLERNLRLGPGIPGPVIPWQDQLLLPGAVDESARLRSPGGAFRWRIYWREEGVDEQ